MLSARALREMAEKVGPRGYLKLQARLLGLSPDGRMRRDASGKIQPLAEKVTLENGREIGRMRPHEFSLRGLWEGLVGPVEETLNYCRDSVGFHEMPVHVLEAVSTGAFPSAVGQLISTMVIDGYEDDSGFIGDRLVSTMPSKLRGERIVGFTSLQGPKEVVEGEQYQDSTFQDKYVGSRETKRGRLLSVTEEAVYFDQTGQVLERARQLGYYSRQERERRIVRAVIDADSGETVYAPSGTGEQLYAAGNNNLDTATGPLVDWTDIQAVLAFHATNTVDDRETDDALAGQPIVWTPKIILTGVELAGNAARLIAATEVTRDPGSNQAEFRSGNPLNSLAPGMVSLSSPFIDNATDGDQWDDGSDWFIGDFQRQFKYKEIWPLQTFRAPAQNEEQFTRDIVARFKVREYGDVIAVDERHVVKVDIA